MVKKRFAFFVIGILVLMASSFAAAVENKSACPKDFDPDDSAWVLNSIERSAGNPAIAERKFLYQPHERHAKLLRKAPVENCRGSVISYMLPGYKNSDVLKEKRVRMQLRTPAGDTFYLMTEGGKWLRGTRIVEAGDYSQTKSSRLRLILYNGNRIVGERAILISGKEKEFKLEFNIQVN